VMILEAENTPTPRVAERSGPIRSLLHESRRVTGMLRLQGDEVESAALQAPRRVSAGLRPIEQCDQAEPAILHVHVNNPTAEEIVPLLSNVIARGSILAPGGFSPAGGPDGP
jgi:hypothetical protein